MKWRPFYWVDIPGDWIYRAGVTIGLGCFAFVVGLLLVVVAISVVEAL